MRKSKRKALALITKKSVRVFKFYVVEMAVGTMMSNRVG